MSTTGHACSASRQPCAAAIRSSAGCSAALFAHRSTNASTLISPAASCCCSRSPSSAASCAASCSLQAQQGERGVGGAESSTWQHHGTQCAVPACSLPCLYANKRRSCLPPHAIHAAVSSGYLPAVRSPSAYLRISTSGLSLESTTCWRAHLSSNCALAGAYSPDRMMAIW